MSNRKITRSKKAISTLESESPVDLYWLHRPNREREVHTPKNSDGGPTIISDVFWDDFVLVAKAVKHMNPDADIYDAFNFIREHMLGGWTYLEDGPFITKIDAEVEREYKREQRKKNDARRS